MGITAVTSRHIDLTMVLQIDGLAACFYSGAVEPSSAALTAIGGTVSSPAGPADNAWSRGLESVGATACGISLVEGVATSSSVSVRVLIQTDNAARDLLRRGPLGATARTTLASALAGVQAAAPLTVTAADPISAFPATGVIWIGQEALEYDAKDDAARTFTVPIGGRGALGTRIQRHLADAARSRAPRIYGECCAWTRRPARVWVGQLDAAGDWIDAPVVEAEGYVSGIPQRDQAGAIEVQLETLPSVLDAEFGGAQSDATLQPGWHLFDGVNANRFDAWAQIWTEAAAYSDTARAALAAGGDPITAPVGALPQLFKADDPVAMALVLRKTPGAGLMPITSMVPGVSVDDPAGTIDTTNGAVAAIVVGDRITNARLEYVSDHVFGTAGTASVVRWPAAVDGLLLDMQAAVSAGGPWAAATIAADGTMSVTAQWSTPTPAPMLLRWLMPEASTCWGLCPGSELPAITEAGIDQGDWPAFDPRSRRERQRSPRPAPAQSPEVRLSASGEETYRLTIPSAWYQPPERYMLVDDTVAGGASAGSPKWIVAKHQRGGADVRSAYRAISEALASTITVGAPGYAVEIHEDDRTGAAVATLEGSEPPVIRPVAAWRDAPTSTIIRQAVGSYTGMGVLGADDVQPYGLGVPSALIEGGRFDAMELDALGARSHMFDEAVDSKAIISALCRSIGAVLTERLDQSDGRRKLSLEPVGLPTPQQSVATIGDGDWLVDGRPVVTVDTETVTRIAFGMQWGDPLQRVSVEDEDRGTYTVTVVDSDSEGEAGEPSSEDLPLYGIRADNDDPRILQDTLLPIAQARFAAYGYPRAAVQGDVSYSLGVVLYPGAVVTLSGVEIDGYDGQPIGSTPALLTSVERDVMAQRATIRAVYWPSSGAGWAPALQVPSGSTGGAIVAGDPITVTASHYAPSVSPIGAAQKDVDLFAVGDAVSWVPRGDYASKVDATITAIDRAANTVDLSADVTDDPATIRPRAYTAVSSLLRGYAYLCDAGDLEQSNGAAAKVYA